MSRPVKNEAGVVLARDGKWEYPWTEVDGKWVRRQVDARTVPERRASDLPPAARAAQLARGNRQLKEFTRDGITVKIRRRPVHNTVTDHLEVWLASAEDEGGNELYIESGHFTFHNPPLGVDEDGASPEVALQQIIVDTIKRIQP